MFQQLRGADKSLRSAQSLRQTQVQTDRDRRFADPESGIREVRLDQEPGLQRIRPCLPHQPWYAKVCALYKTSAISDVKNCCIDCYCLEEEH